VHRRVDRCGDETLLAHQPFGEVDPFTEA